MARFPAGKCAMLLIQLGQLERNFVKHNFLLSTNLHRDTLSKVYMPDHISCRW